MMRPGQPSSLSHSDAADRPISGTDADPLSLDIGPLEGATLSLFYDHYGWCEGVVTSAVGLVCVVSFGESNETGGAFEEEVTLPDDTIRVVRWGDGGSPTGAWAAHPAASASALSESALPAASARASHQVVKVKRRTETPAGPPAQKRQRPEPEGRCATPLRGTSASPVLPHGAREGVRRFYEFVSARMLVWANRTAGLAPEDWTADPKLRWGHFCNVYVRTGPQSVGRRRPPVGPGPTDRLGTGARALTCDRPPSVRPGACPAVSCLC